MQKLLVFQALWAMERRHTDGFERSLEENVRMIAEAGFDGISGDWRDRNKCRQMSDLMKAHNLTAEGQCFPRTIDDLKPALENATEFRLHHLDIQPDVRPRKLNDCIPLIEGWRRLSEEVDFPVYIETHRDRMTTDLFFVLDLLECFPDLKLLADLSHFLVGREFAWPIDAENHGYIHEVLDHSWAFHGRVASREQVRHPRTRFLLMHLAYPWARDLLGMALIYRNIWIDLCWAPLLSPTLFRQSLHEAIEVLPDESRMMIGGDNWHAEETYGAMTLARRILGEVLEEKIGSGYFTEADAQRLAPKILSENANAFFGLDR